MKLEKQYQALKNQLNKYKNKELSYELGCECGIIKNVEYIEDNTWGDRIKITLSGLCGLEHYIELRSKEYRYLKEYHMIEFNTDSPRLYCY